MITQQQSPSLHWVQSSLFSFKLSTTSLCFHTSLGKWGARCQHTLMKDAFCLLLHTSVSCSVDASPTQPPISFSIPLLLHLPALFVLWVQRGCGAQALTVPSCCCWLCLCGAGVTLYFLQNFTAARSTFLQVLM